MIHFTPRTFAGWIGAWVLALVNGLIAGLIVGFTLGSIWVDEDDDGWAALGDALATGMAGAGAGVAVVLVVVALATNAWVAPGRGWWGSWALVWSFTLACMLAVAVLTVGGDSGPADIIVGWAILPIVLAAHLDGLRMIERRVAVVTAVVAVSVMVVAVVVS